MILFKLFPAKVSGQDNKLFISGKVSDASTSEKLVGATVYSIGTNKGVVTDVNGFFRIAVIKNDTLKVKFIGYIDLILPISDLNELTIKLEPKAQQLQDVTIEGKSITQEKKEEPFNVSVASAKPFENRPGDVAQIANQMPGVRLRNTGGLGSDYTISLFGMSGNSVRILKDGIPLEYYGKGFQLNNIIPQNIERIEFYKGAVPIYLGADALGGAVNIVSKPIYKKSLVASYESGSFNTHRANLSLNIPSKSNKLVFGLIGNFNFSDNSYFTDVQKANFTTGQIIDTTLRRFHNQFLSFSTLGQLRILDQKWADDFSVNIGVGQFNNQLQHGFTLTLIPVGEAKFNEFYIPVNFNYKKTFKDKHQLQLNGAYNYSQTAFTDTSSNIYSWDGSIVAQNPQQQFGELGFKSIATQFRSTGVLREHYKISLHKNHSIEFAATQTFFTRTGTDPIIEENLGFNPLAAKAFMFKNISGVAYNFISDNSRWNFIASSKHFYNHIEGTENIVFVPIPPNRVSSQNHFWGGNIALKYTLNENLFLRISYEYAGRLPSEQEALGDGLFINGNPNLKPEKSHNINAGFVLSFNKTKSILAIWEVNGFYRFVDDIIVLQNALFIPQYDNLFKAQGIGGETELTFRFKNFIELKTNATYIDFRKKGFIDLSDKPLDGKRIPNIPYLFSNTHLNIAFKNVFTKSDGLSFYTYYQYVYEFYLFFDGGIASQKPTIPTQHNLSSGIVYSILNNKLNFALECRNILNYNLFDNFRVQLPGRGFFGKISINI